MKAGKGSKVLLGLATLWPIVYVAAFFLLIAARVLVRPLSPPARTALFVFHFGTIVWTIGLLAWYLRFLFRSDRVAPEYKLPWALALVLGNVVALPVFFWRAVWKEPDVVS